MMFQRTKLAAVGVACCLFFGALAAGAENSEPSVVTAAKGLSKAFQHVAEVAAPSIVSLEVRVKPGLGWTWWQGGSAVNDPLSNPNRDRTPDWIRRSVPQMDAARPTHVGSGFLIDDKGTVLTAFHVVELFGDGVHDLDLMLWYTGAKPKTVYAQTSNTRPHLPHDDLGWAMFRFDDGAIAVIENVWCLPENAPFAIDARMEIIGTEGAIYIDNSGSQYTLLTKNGLSYPQSTYWPKVHGLRRGYLKEELDYFLKCVLAGETPSVITPRESRDVVHAVLMAERSARENRLIEFAP